MFQFFKVWIAKSFIWGSFFLSMGIVFFLFLFLFHESLPVIEKEGLGFFVGLEWRVGTSYGAWPMVYGTILVTALAVCFALPFGVGTAVVSSEFLSGRYRLFIKSIMELLAGIPGVVYGLLGMVFITTWVRWVFDLQDGNTLFTAGLILGIMILPTVMTLSDDAMRSVPREYRDQALALGLNKVETIFHVVFPNAIRGIMGGLLLGISRAMGETIAVMLVIGSVDRLPHPIYNIFSSSQTITSKLGREAAEAVGTIDHWSALMALGLVLFLMVLVVTSIAGLAISAFPQNRAYVKGGSS